MNFSKVISIDKHKTIVIKSELSCDNLKDFSEKLYFELKEINKISKNFKNK